MVKVNTMIAASFLLATLPLLGQHSPALPISACGSELANAEAALAHIPQLDRDRLARGAKRASALFRFRRTKEAVQQIDRVHIRLGGTWGQRVPAAVRHETLNAIAVFRDCVATARPPAFATLTVRTFKEDETKPDNRGQQAGAGVLIRVEDERVGQTGRDGTLTVQVPSGP